MYVFPTLDKLDWILFDADETLFHFDAFSGLQRMLAKHNLYFSEEDYGHYQAVNKPLWDRYQNGEIDAETLQVTRFENLGKRLNITPKQLNRDFLDAMAEICAPLPGVTTLLNTLQPHVKLGIITNGFTQLQQVRLARTGFQQHFEFVIISEQVGVAKPDVGIFNAAMDKMGRPHQSRVLMVGDNPHSDVKGGLNAGFHTCWFNPSQAVTPEGITPHLIVSDYTQLLTKLGCE